ncbi:MAG: hypothetical protein ACK56F_24740, partial [bacterium]
VDAPRDVVEHADAHDATPEEAEERTRPTHRDQAADRGGDRQTKQHPQREESVDAHGGRVGKKIGHVALHVGAEVGEEPAHVRVQESLHGALEAGLASRVRRMRIVLVVRVLVVA